MDTLRDWQLTRRYRCPSCGKRYIVAEWKQNPRCRQCGADLLADDGVSQTAQGKTKQQLTGPA